MTRVRIAPPDAEEDVSAEQVAARRTLAIPPAGAFCTHARMRYVSCGCGRRACYLECPCGLDWSLDEGAYG